MYRRRLRPGEGATIASSAEGEKFVGFRIPCLKLWIEAKQLFELFPLSR